MRSANSSGPHPRSLLAPSILRCLGPAEPLVASHGKVRCWACAEVCPACGRPAKDLSHPTCRRVCDAARSNPRRVCRLRPAGVLLDDDARCRRCREEAVRVCDTCHGQEPLTGGRCHRCLLAEEFDEILGENPSDWLVALRASVLTTANTTSTSKWLRRTSSGRLLMSMVRGRLDPLACPASSAPPRRTGRVDNALGRQRPTSDPTDSAVRRRRREP